MRKAIAVLLFAAVLVGVGPAVNLAFAETAHETPVGTSHVHQPCMSLGQLNTMRQEMAKHVLQSLTPVAAYREDLEKARQAIAAQPYECIAALHSAVVRERATRLTHLMYECGCSGAPDVTASAGGRDYEYSGGSGYLDVGKTVNDILNIGYSLDIALGATALGVSAVGGYMGVVSPSWQQTLNIVGISVAWLGAVGQLMQLAMDKINGSGGTGCSCGGPLDTAVH